MHSHVKHVNAARIPTLQSYSVQQRCNLMRCDGFAKWNVAEGHAVETRAVMAVLCCFEKSFQRKTEAIKSEACVAVPTEAGKCLERLDVRTSSGTFRVSTYFLRAYLLLLEMRDMCIQFSSSCSSASSHYILSRIEKFVQLKPFRRFEKRVCMRFSRSPP